MPKRRCVFAPNLKSEFPFLKDADEVGKVFCTICKSVFSIEHGGLSDIKQHTTKVKKHLLALSAASKNEKMQFIFINSIRVLLECDAQYYVRKTAYLWAHSSNWPPTSSGSFFHKTKRTRRVVGDLRHTTMDKRKVSSTPPLCRRGRHQVIFMEMLLKFVVAVISTTVSVYRSHGFCGLRDKFRRFDEIALGRSGSPPRAGPQALYLLYVFSVGLYNYTCSFAYKGMGYYVPFMWVALCTSTMIPVVQYVTYVRMLRERYESANGTFSNSVVKPSSTSFDGTRAHVYPSEMNSLYIKLHGLTEDVKAYFACHAVLIIVESVIILISSVTTLTINCLNKLDTRFIHNGYFVMHCAFRLLFLFYVVRETHITVLETKNTALIGHEVLSMTSDTITMKYVEIIVLNCWNHPIVFDVHDFFDLDYKLLQSIIASVVTYVVILVQIHLAIMEVQE